MLHNFIYFLKVLFPSLCQFLFHLYCTFSGTNSLSWAMNCLHPELSPPLSISFYFETSNCELIMWIKIEQWLFVPVPACHWSRMNNSDTVDEIRIREKKRFILRRHHSGYFRTVNCQRLSCSAYAFFSFSSCCLSFLSLAHSLSHKDGTDSSLFLCPWKWPQTEHIQSCGKESKPSFRVLSIKRVW